MTIQDELPHDPEAAHALVRQKLNEHSIAIREIREENIKQNIKLDQIDKKLDSVHDRTEGIVTLVGFMKRLCHGVKIFGKFICWISAVAGAAVALYQLYIMYWNP